jgi:NAD(P)-dependent dehydrogenase (short-subunit alcohol dehydrogenase family)
MTDPEVTWNELDNTVTTMRTDMEDYYESYTLSKAGLHSYTMLTAREHPNLKVSVVHPGFLDTRMTRSINAGATASPEEGTRSIRHALFEDLEGSGYYYNAEAEGESLSEKYLETRRNDPKLQALEKPGGWENDNYNDEML